MDSFPARPTAPVDLRSPTGSLKITRQGAAIAIDLDPSVLAASAFLKGDKGDAGGQGIPGQRGPQGLPTTVNGKTGDTINLNATDVGAWNDATPAVAAQSKKINFRQRKFLLSDYGLVASANDATTLANNVAGVNQAFTDLIASAAGGQIVVDDVYYLGQGISQTIPTGHSCKVEGHTPGSTLFWYGSNVGAGLTLRAGAYDAVVGVKNLRLRSDQCPNIGDLIVVRGGGSKLGLDVQHLYLEGSTTSRPGNFLTLINPYNCEFVGLNVEAGSVGSYGSSGIAFNVYGDKLLGAGICVDFSFKACMATRVNTGFYLRAATSGTHTIEGAMFDSCILAGVQTGLDWQSVGDLTPGMHWKGGHINASKYGAVLGNIAQFKFEGVLFYMDVYNSPVAALQIQNGCYDVGVFNSTVFLVDTQATGLKPALNHFIVTGSSKLTRINDVLCETYTADPCLRIDSGCYGTMYEGIRKVNAARNNTPATGAYVSDAGTSTQNCGRNVLL